MGIESLSPPVPPKSTIDPQQRLETFRQMGSELKAEVEYRQKSIEYHQESLAFNQEKLADAQAQLEIATSAIESMTQRQKLTATVDNHLSNGSGKVKDTQSDSSQDLVEETKEIKETKEAKTQTSTKSKTDSKAKKAKASTKTKTSSKAKKATEKVGRSNIPPSDKLSQFENLTSAVLSFSQKQEGVIGVGDLIEHFYGDTLKDAELKKASNSFSSVLSAQAKKRVLERTVPGKYLYKSK